MRGVFVPQSLAPAAADGHFNHVHLSTASHVSAEAPDDLQMQAGLSSAQDVQGHRTLVASELRDELGALYRPPAFMVLSNEHIHSRLRTEADIAQLKQLLDGCYDRLLVVVYLRPQHELARSLASTALRNGAPKIRLLPRFDSAQGFDDILGVDFGYFDYAALLDRLSRVFGRAALRVRLYGTQDLYGGDTIEDFFHLIGINIEGLAKPDRENQSLSAKTAAFMAVWNQCLPRDPDFARLRLKLVEHIEKISAGGALHESPAEVRRFMSLFAESNEAVRAAWFPERDTLFPIPGDGEDSSLPKISVVDAFQIFGAMFREMAAAG